MRDWVFSHLKRKRTWAILFFGGILFLAVTANVLTYRHAYSALHFVEAKGWKQSGPLHIVLHGFPVPKPANHATPSGVALAYETLTVPVDGEVRLEAWYMPRKNAKGFALLFHGQAVAKWVLLQEARAFHDKGYSVFLTDFRGSGGSNQSYTTVGYKEADDVTACFRYVRKNLSANLPIILFGQSMGAAAVLRAVAVHGLKPQAVILQSVFDTLENAVTNNFTSVGAPAFPIVPMILFWGGVQNGFDPAEHNPVGYAAQVDCPVLVLHGSTDRQAKLEDGRRVFQALRGRKKFVVFRGHGHVGLLDADRRLWMEEVFGFLGA